jgi:uncharacterized protein (DUF2461 family)
MATSFEGWPADALAVLAEIAADNRAELWQEVRDRHTAAVRGPTLALAAELEAEFGPVRVLRPHVSRRFRPDAPPLRTDTGGVAGSAGGCGLAFVLSATALAVTAGHFRFDRGQMHRYRAAVAGGSPAAPGVGEAAPPGSPPALADAAYASQSPGTLRSVSEVCEERGAPDSGAELAAVLDVLAEEGFLPDADGELRGTPRGWRADHPRIALARRRGLQVVRRWEVGPWISTAESLERVRAAWQATGPLIDWLDKHVGAPDAVVPRPRRGPPVPTA